jgi:hypothetical protein
MMMVEKVLYNFKHSYYLILYMLHYHLYYAILTISNVLSRPHLIRMSLRICMTPMAHLTNKSVELIILSRCNAKTKFLKTYSHYLSLIKWFRNQYNMMLILIRDNLWFKYKNMLIYGGLV